MLYPLQELIDFSGNIYEVTCATARRAFQLSKLKDSELEEYEDKIVSLAARQIFTKEVEYLIEDSSDLNA